MAILLLATIQWNMEYGACKEGKGGRGEKGKQQQKTPDFPFPPFSLFPPYTTIYF